MASLQKITPCLWFDANAEEAVEHYLSIFKNSRVVTRTRYNEVGPGVNGTVMAIEFELDGQRVVALNGGPLFRFTEAVSLVVNCESQAELDHFWDRLAEGGQPGQCGWLKDKYGLSWQIVPSALIEMLRDEDAEKAARVMRAIMKMKKLDLTALERAHRGGLA
jgi:predicted 3-demethylubiquinone-9 3-methyltransferase (glyoxalase superfamily)